MWIGVLLWISLLTGGCADLLVPMTAEDCLPGEVFNTEFEVCTVPCEEDEACADDLLTLVFDLVDEILAEFTGPDFEDFDAAGQDALVTYAIVDDTLTLPQFHNAAENPAAQIYTVADLVAYQEDYARHLALWQRFAEMIPAAERPYLTRFVIFTDGTEETYAAVAPDPDDPSQWVLAVDIVDAADQREFLLTLIHEHGHLLTLNAAQVPPDVALLGLEDDPEAYDALYAEAEAACPTYFTGEGCSQPNAYVNAFFERFWLDLYDEWNEIQYEEDEDRYYELMDAFYQTYQAQFVTDYAATNPAEDIAESWMLFVLQPEPTGDTIADEKVRFFYAYPELVALRARILEQVDESLLDAE